MRCQSQFAGLEMRFDLTALAVVSIPQHLMNVVQAIESGFLQEPVECVVLDYGKEQGAYASTIMRGTQNYFASVLPTVVFRNKTMWRRGSSIQSALEARFLGRQCATLVLGIGLTGFWARSAVRRAGGRLIFVDDGASSLDLPFNSLLDDRQWVKSGSLPTKALHLLAGPAANTAPNPEIYTAFHVRRSPWRVIHHDYGALRALVSDRPPHDDLGQGIGGKRVWVDSGYAPLIGEKEHLALVDAVMRHIDFHIYVPHRRVEQTLVDEIVRRYGVRVVRPAVPVEMLISSWTRSGAQIFTPPSSLAVTGGHFVEEPGSLFALAIADWLQNRFYESKQEVSRELDYVLNTARLVEANPEAGTRWLTVAIES